MARRTVGPVTRVPAFWDASALVPLCVRQGLTPQALSLYKTHDAVVWWATPVEIASALARLMRTSQLNPHDWAKASKLAKKSGGSVVCDSAVRRLADDFDATRRSLRLAGS